MRPEPGVLPVTGPVPQGGPAAGAEGDAGTGALGGDRALGERLRATLSDSGAAAAWEWHVADKRIVGDSGFATLFGITAADATRGITPPQFFGAIHPADRDRIRLAIGGMMRGSEVLSKQYRLVAPDGTVRWIQATGRAHRAAGNPAEDIPALGAEAEDARPVRLSGVLVDITEQKRLEEQLRIAQTAGGVGTFEHVDGFGTVAVSAQFCALLGLHPAADLPVRTVNAVIHPDDPALIDTAARPRSGTLSQVDLRIRRRDTGELRWLTRRGEYLRDAETTGLRFSGVVYDITQAKRIEGELRGLNENLEARVAERTRERDRIWRVSQDLLGVIDMAGRWISINPAWTALLGWEERDVVGRDSERLEHADDMAETRRQMARLAKGETILKFENRFLGKDGAYRWLSWTAVPEGGLIYCVARDMTAEKAAQAELAQAQEQLRQSQKMEAVGQLTGGLAHDFNNLLTGIAGSLELLAARIAQGRLNDAERYITAAQGAAKRAAALTHRLLAFSRRQTLEPKPTDVNKLVAGMDELVRRMMGPAISVEVVTAGGLWTTLVDPPQLENALLNLCINARDAMPGGGQLTIEPGNRWLDEHAAGERELPPGQYVSLCVSDNGTGMPPEVVLRAFDPFFTTKPLGEGTGLGLSMIYGFARQSGGQVRIYSELGSGTMVCVYLPRHLGEAEAAGPDAALAAAPRAGSGETVLVVDDEPTIRMLASEVLEDLGYLAIEAADGAAALKVLQSDARVDLLVTDIGLPGGMNGREVAEAGRVVRPELKVLFMTGYAENAVLSHGHLSHGMHVLTKPFAMDVLARRIRLLITGA